MQCTKYFKEKFVLVRSQSDLTGQQPLGLSWRNAAFFGTIHALALLAPWYFSWSALGMMLALYWLLGIVGNSSSQNNGVSSKSGAATPACESDRI